MFDLGLRRGDGDTIVVEGGRVHALLPLASGVQVERASLSAAHFEAMGRALAEIQSALAGCSRDLVDEQKFCVQADQTIAEINRFLSVIDETPTPDPTDANARERLTSRREWLGKHGEEDIDPFAGFDRQPIHGDYQEGNLFFTGDNISCVIDWDNVSWSPTEWEIARFLDYVVRYNGVKAASFLAGYRALRPISDERLDESIRAYGLYRAHDLWLFREIYDRRNHKARRFLTPGRFKPHYQRWVQR